VRALRAAVAPRSDAAIIEDCAHSFESRYKRGELPGARSDAAIFSFYTTKNVTCSEGAAVITRRAGLYNAVLQGRMHGMSAGAVDRFTTSKYQHWDMLRSGTKPNLSDLLAALLPRQIPTIRNPTKKGADWQLHRAPTILPSKAVARVAFHVPSPIISLH
jgi:dTDP-4-amino-4,6-dideoxygalactose transaminase